MQLQQHTMPIRICELLLFDPQEVISSHAAGTSSSGAAATQAGSGQPATSGATNGHPSTDAQGGSDVSSSAQLQGVTILDVRPVTQFSLFSLPNSVNIPFEQLEARAEEVKALAARAAEASASASGQAGYQATAAAPANSSSSSENGTGIPGKLVLLCRRGNNSQKTALLLKQWGVHNVTDVVGGIEAWAKSLDPSMPVL
jgi:rhodanese-related sulfurtransferase